MGIFIVVVLVAVILACLLKGPLTSTVGNKTSPYLTDEELQKRNAEFCKKRDHATGILISLVKEHSRALLTKRNQLMTKDAYGQYQSEKWIDEVVYFLDNILAPATARAGIDMESCWSSLLSTEKCFNIINDELDKHCHDEQSNINPDADFDTLDPIEYEMFCVHILTSIGWSARITKASGDQGVDIIAEKGTLKAVVQCKQYSNPVGNKAVQEVFAGKQHELADIAAVVTNSRFTKSAEELAHTCNVILLHHSQLRLFDEYVNQRV